MFTLARQLVRHKVGVVAVVAFAVVMFAGSGADDQRERPSNPWSSQEPAQVAKAGKPQEDSITGRIGEVAAAAGDVAAEKLLGDKDLNPVKMGSDAADNFNTTNDAFSKANGGN